jgi:hypothetical protein
VVRDEITLDCSSSGHVRGKRVRATRSSTGRGATNAPAAPRAASGPQGGPRDETGVDGVAVRLVGLNFYNTAPLANADIPTAALVGDDDALGATARQAGLD